MNSKKEDTVDLMRPQKLQLTKTVESRKVQQSFSHGKTNTVTVEVKKTRTFSRNESGAMVYETNAKIAGAMKEASLPDGLTEGERQSRLQALKEAETNKLKLAEADADQSKQVGRQKEAQGLRPEPAADAKLQPKAKAPASAEKLTLTREGDGVTAEQRDAQVKGRGKGEPKRRSGKISISQALEQEERVRSLASIRRAREKAKRQESPSKSRDLEKIIREVTFSETIEVQELANRMAVRSIDVVKSLMKLGIMVTINQKIDADTAELIVTEFGHTPKLVQESDVENVLREEEEDPENLQPRPPVVTIMGHVDHGKTSLLDAIRSTDVAAGEAGGITQHIGAHQITLPDGHQITFLDTPGHEAFTAMRARGAKVTDIVVLVVAADDGVMPQTVEAINHAKAARVPIIVAVNKIDKPDANPRKVRDELLLHELVPEDLGGDVMVVEVSAQKRINLDKLLETILLQSEVLELTANPDRNALGTVIEAKVDRGRGAVATVIVQKGTLENGNIVVAGGAFGKVRALMDDKGNQLESAGPSMPVEIIGLDEVPSAGDPFVVVESERVAREITEYRQRQVRSTRTAAVQKLSIEQMLKKASDQGLKELSVLVKADVQGSAEALVGALTKLATEEVAVKIIHQAVGGITESDIGLAHATSAIIIGFNVRATPQARELAVREGVEIRYYSIIYNAIDDMKAMLSGLLPPAIREEFIGYAEIRQVFNLTKVGKIAGGFVREGLVIKNAGVRLLRDNVVIYEGKLRTLKRFKDEVKEVKEGFECGIQLENFEDLKEGDQIEAFRVIEEKRTIQ